MVVAKAVHPVPTLEISPILLRAFSVQHVKTRSLVTEVPVRTALRVRGAAGNSLGREALGLGDQSTS